MNFALTTARIPQLESQNICESSIL